MQTEFRSHVAIDDIVRCINAKPLFLQSFITPEPAPYLPTPEEACNLPLETSSLIQKVRDIERSLLLPAVDATAIPPNGQPVIHNLITSLQIQLKMSKNDAGSLSGGVFLAWIGNKIVAIATAICRIASSFFHSSPPAIPISAILDELKYCRAISPAQHETVLQLSQQAEKKPSLILLTALLGFSTTELSPLLSEALNTSPEHAFSLLLECYLIKHLTSIPILKTLMNEDDIACFTNISFENLRSFDTIKEQLRCLRSVSFRHTLRSWVANLSTLLGHPFDHTLSQACIAALKKNDPKAFAKALSPFLKNVASSPISNESLYAKELLAFISSAFSFETLASEVQREKFLSHWGNQLTELKKAGKAVINAHQCSKIGHLALKRVEEILQNADIRSRYLPSETPFCATFRATQFGSINRSTRKIDALGKRIATEMAPSGPPQEDLKSSKHILHLACSCGGGHSGMVQALTKSFEAASGQTQYNFTSQTLDVPVQVTRPLDIAYSFLHNLGLNIDTTWIYNFLLRHDLCSVIELLKWLTSGDPSPAAAEKKRMLIRQAILTTDPDFLNMVYAFDGIDIDAVSSQLGLPLLYVATDLDLDDWKHTPTSPYFREAVPSLQDPSIRSTLHLPEECVEEVGLCVGPQFEKRLTDVELAAVREKYGIHPNEKVILFSNGGAALQNTIPERIALEYDDATAPVRLIVVCGRNETFKKYLETKVAPYIADGAPVTMTVLGFQQREQMAELAQMADVAIGKPGGMSTMEFIKAGTRVIFDESSHRLRWEKFNASVLVNSGRGTIMTSPDQVLQLVSDALKLPRRAPMKIARVKASERYVSLVDRLLTSANRPQEEGGWRDKRRSWHRMNKQMAQSNIW